MRTFLISAVLLFSVCALAQNHPLPGSVFDPPVICTGCAWNNSAGEPNEGLPTYPYDSPLFVHAGRFLDSASAPTVQNAGMRTLRAQLVRVAPSRNRIYLGMGATIGAYTLDTFFSDKLKAPMVVVNTISTGNPYESNRHGFPFEKVSRPDRFSYPEASNSGWTTAITDTSDIGTDFDADDRGYVYVGTSVFGWGILSDPGGASGTILPRVKQTMDNVSQLLSLRSGSSYFVYLSGTSSTGPTALYDVTDPTNPTLQRYQSGQSIRMVNWSKYETGQRVAIAAYDGHVRVYTYAGLIAGSAPLIDVTPTSGKKFVDVSFDDDGNMWLVERLSNPVSGVLWKLTPSGEGYATTTFDVYGSAFAPTSIHAAAGYVAITGYIADGQMVFDDLRLFRVTGGTPQLLDTDDYFRKYYSHAPSGYAEPGPYSEIFQSVHLMTEGARTYLFLNFFGMGDVYELGDGPRITSIAPRSGIPAGGTNVSIYGTGFAAGSNVTFDGVLAGSTFVSATQITAVSPMHASAVVDVVVSPPGAAALTAPRQFTYELIAPQVVATATSTISVSVTWNSVAGATSYEVSRRSPDGSWSVIGTPAGTSFTDGGRTAETTYVYRVRALDAALNASSYSVIDLATTMGSNATAFTAGMPILASDFTTLKMRVDAVRAAAGLSSPWPYAVPAPSLGVTVRTTHISELRGALNQARIALGYEKAVFTDSALSGVRIKALHLNELLNLMR